MKPDVQLTVSDFVALTNQTLEYAYSSVVVVGEVAEFRVAQGKWVSFKLKDSTALVNCFMSAYMLRQPLEDGMKIAVTATPRLNPKGYFNLSIKSIRLVGEGTIKKGFELLKAKLDAEGLFSPERKRQLPRVPKRVAVITSTESAAYADFCKIINERWGGLEVTVAHTQVQGEPAADQIIRAIKYINGLEELPEVLVIIRGGGSTEDLMTFNDELLARTIAESRVPTLVGVGHEIDHTLADMVADKRAATPTNAAEILVPDRRDVVSSVRGQVDIARRRTLQVVDNTSSDVHRQIDMAHHLVVSRLDNVTERLKLMYGIIGQLHPDNVLRQGYALVRGQLSVGSDIEIETIDKLIKAEVKNVRQKDNR